MNERMDDTRARAAALASAFVGYNADNELADKIMDIVRDAVAQAVKERDAEREYLERKIESLHVLAEARAEEIARLRKQLELAKRIIDRLPLCPDHRDKVRGHCIECANEGLVNAAETLLERHALVCDETCNLSGVDDLRAAIALAKGAKASSTRPTVHG